MVVAVVKGVLVSLGATSADVGAHNNNPEP